MPQFQPRFPWWGGDLQTLRNRFAYKHRPLGGQSQPVRIETSDDIGDTLTGTLHRPSDPARQPLIVLFHGLTGSEDSMYMLESTRHHMDEGRAVLRMNLRGAGSSQALSKRLYSGASWPDILTVLDALDYELTKFGVVVVGYSMGGNILLNALSHLPQDTRCIGAASVSAPIDPLSASLRLMDRRNAVYQRALLSEMKTQYLALPIGQDPAMRKAIEAAESIYTFDDAVTAPTNGFRDAAHYYEETAGLSKLKDSRVPTLLIHARNDPWIPVAPYLALKPPPHVALDITRSGGHVGFHGRPGAQPWHDLRISRFIEGLGISG